MVTTRQTLEALLMPLARCLVALVEAQDKEGGDMSKGQMAECLEEADALLQAHVRKTQGEGYEENPGEAYYTDYKTVATIAVALYRERGKHVEVVEVGEEELRRSYPWRYSEFSLVQTAKPMVCQDCSQVWTEGHLCPAAGSRGTARWPAS